MPEMSFIEDELDKFLFSSMSEITTNRTLLGMIEMTGKLVEAGRQDIVNELYKQTASVSVYSATLNREILWRENVFAPIKVFDTNKKLLKEHEQLVHPTDTNSLKNTISIILQKWSEILNYLDEDKFLLPENKAVKTTIRFAIARESIKILSSALFQARNTANWDLSLERQLLESFNEPEKLKEVMEQAAKYLQRPQLNKIFPPELYSLLNFVDFNEDAGYLKKRIFFPLLVDSGYVKSVTDSMLPKEKKIENRQSLNTSTFPPEVPFLDAYSTEENNDCLSMIKILGNTEGLYHYILSLAEPELRNVLKNKEVWKQLIRRADTIPQDSSKKDMRREEVFEYKALILFLRMVQTHLRLTVSTHNTVNKVDDFMNVLDEMLLQEYKIEQNNSGKKDKRLSQEVSEKAKYSGFFTSGFKNSYAHQRDELALFFERNASFDLCCPQKLGCTLIEKKDSSKAIVLDKAILMYINYFNIRIQQDKSKTHELTHTEKILLLKLNQKPAFQGLGLKPHVQITAVGQFTEGYPRVPLAPVEPTAPQLPVGVAAMESSSDSSKLPQAIPVDPPVMAIHVAAMSIFQGEPAIETRLTKPQVQEGNVHEDNSTRVCVSAP